MKEFYHIPFNDDFVFEVFVMLDKKYYDSSVNSFLFLSKYTPSFYRANPRTK